MSKDAHQKQNIVIPLRQFNIEEPNPVLQTTTILNSLAVTNTAASQAVAGNTAVKRKDTQSTTGKATMIPIPMQQFSYMSPKNVGLQAQHISVPNQFAHKIVTPALFSQIPTSLTQRINRAQHL